MNLNLTRDELINIIIDYSRDELKVILSYKDFSIESSGSSKVDSLDLLEISIHLEGMYDFSFCLEDSKYNTLGELVQIVLDKLEELKNKV